MDRDNSLDTIAKKKPYKSEATSSPWPSGGTFMIHFVAVKATTGQQGNYLWF